MISSTFGAPLGGTMRGGHQGLESLALSLITPPNFGGGGGSCFPSIVVVASGEPSVPVTCCAAAGATTSAAASQQCRHCCGGACGQHTSQNVHIEYPFSSKLSRGQFGFAWGRDDVIARSARGDVRNGVNRIHGHGMLAPPQDS